MNGLKKRPGKVLLSGPSVSSCILFFYGLITRDSTFEEAELRVRPGEDVSDKKRRKSDYSVVHINEKDAYVDSRDKLSY